MRWMMWILIVFLCSACQSGTPSSPGSSPAPSVSSSPTPPDPNPSSSPVVQASPTPTAISNLPTPQPSATPVRYAQLIKQENAPGRYSCQDYKGNFYHIGIPTGTSSTREPNKLLKYEQGKYNLFAGGELGFVDGVREQAEFNHIIHCLIVDQNMYLFDVISLRKLDLVTGLISTFSGKHHTSLTKNEKYKQVDGESQAAIFSDPTRLIYDEIEKRLLVIDVGGENEFTLRTIDINNGDVTTLNQAGIHSAPSMFGSIYDIITHLDLDGIYLNRHSRAQILIAKPNQLKLFQDPPFEDPQDFAYRPKLNGPLDFSVDLQMAYFARAKQLIFQQNNLVTEKHEILILDPRSTDADRQLKRVLVDLPEGAASTGYFGDIDISPTGEIYFKGYNATYRMTFPDNKMWVSTQPAETHTEADAEVIELLPSE